MVSTSRLQVVKAYLWKEFESRLDLTDLNRSWDGSEKAVLSRALAAWSIYHLADVDFDAAAMSVVDGFNDNGIDAVYYDESNMRLYCVQAKWSESSNSIALGDMLKFLDGMNSLLRDPASLKSSRSRLTHQLDALILAFQNNDIVSVEPVVVYSSFSQLGKDVDDVFQKRMDELKNAGTTVNPHVLNLRNIYPAIRFGVSGKPVDINTTLLGWGQVTTPHLAVYGRVNASEIAQWYSKYESRLFSSNPRFFLGQTDVNEKITSSLLSAPDEFWYKNNGITALCSRYHKSAHSGSETNRGDFQFFDVEIINGAQTVGAIANAAKKDFDKVRSAEVHIRFIALERDNRSLLNNIIVGNNWQNVLSRREFVALDELQENIRLQLKVEDIEYCYKQGDSYQDSQCGFNLEEATRAQVCSQPNIRYALIAQDSIEELWENISRYPYTFLFGDALDPHILWYNVKVFRVVQNEIEILIQEESDGGEILTFGRMFVTQQVMRRWPRPSSSLDDFDVSEAELRSCVRDALDYIQNAKNNEYPDIRAEILFKNRDACVYLDAIIVVEWDQPNSPDEMNELDEILKQKPEL